jgi:hypothetical protein
MFDDPMTEVYFIASFLVLHMLTSFYKGKIKTHIDNPLNWEPSDAVLEKAKHVTRAYNDQHKSQ